MDVYNAVASRRSVRAFTDRRVERSILLRVLTAASRAPSGGNLQPWHVYVLCGDRLSELKERIALRVASGDPGDALEVDAYPAKLESPYRERLADFGQRRYGALGINHDDQVARALVRTGNWECFGASTALFCYLDRDMPPPQWGDAGMYLQTVMLLLRSEGVDSCPQIAWAEYHRTVAQVISPPPQRILYCGMSIGYTDLASPHPKMPRAQLSETVTFLE
ncbi:NADH dehydrogenase [Mycobacterium alsense]|uniref:NADH dehydrogenase n=1 Tax=Mycobacterium alsense TaxID=324058 RepID=A0AA41XWF5_9MYCO|nr:nitroreductase [Mycobacterium alsense]MCV7381765.1 nitroreductase [Mycobacterium alsense]OQZ87862.1 NADH dehydrogenase [Mycobacterium alsense]